MDYALLIFGSLGAMLIGIAPFFNDQKTRAMAFIVALSILTIHTFLTSLWIYFFTSGIGLIGWIKDYLKIEQNEKRNIN
tara:strand:+ start:96 stop:332 length:237 start_codon:yes stop_codon:yes gene_type:complete